MNLAPFRLVLLLIPLALACFALSPQVRATCQQGCLTDENTVLGEDALLNNEDETTQQSVLMRFLATQVAITTLPSVIRRFLAI